VVPVLAQLYEIYLTPSMPKKNRPDCSEPVIEPLTVRSGQNVGPFALAQHGGEVTVEQHLLKEAAMVAGEGVL
jgi:hypothetical protein